MGHTKLLIQTVLSSVNVMTTHVIQCSLKTGFRRLDIAPFPVTLPELVPRLNKRRVELDRSRQERLGFGIVILHNIQGSAFQVKLVSLPLPVRRFYELSVATACGATFADAHCNLGN